MKELKEQIINHKKFIETVIAYKTAKICKKICDENIDKVVSNMDIIAEELECRYDEVYDTIKNYVFLEK